MIFIGVCSLSPPELARDELKKYNLNIYSYTLYVNFKFRAKAKVNASRIEPSDMHESSLHAVRAITHIQAT